MTRREAPGAPELPTAVVTGASGGIGAATARCLAASGFAVVLGARRLQLLEEVAADIGPTARALALDVADADSVERFCAAVPACKLLVNNAGGALGLERVADADEGRWRDMYETNVLGALRMTKALLPKLIASGDGHVVTVGSIAAFEAYVGGAGYNAAKAGASMLSSVLRLELLGQPVRVSEIGPGIVETDFSLVRFAGDAERAAAVYAGLTPLRAEDVASCIAFVATRPSHVNIDRIIVRARDQARADLFHRRGVDEP